MVGPGSSLAAGLVSALSLTLGLHLLDRVPHGPQENLVALWGSLAFKSPTRSIGSSDGVGRIGSPEQRRNLLTLGKLDELVKLRVRRFAAAVAVPIPVLVDGLIDVSAVQILRWHTAR
jgi:hypothetical protein